jgi:hypothetical protein
MLKIGHRPRKQELSSRPEIAQMLHLLLCRHHGPAWASSSNQHYSEQAGPDRREPKGIQYPAFTIGAIGISHHKQCSMVRDWPLYMSNIYFEIKIYFMYSSVVKCQQYFNFKIYYEAKCQPYNNSRLDVNISVQVVAKHRKSFSFLKLLIMALMSTL